MTCRVWARDLMLRERTEHVTRCQATVPRNHQSGYEGLLNAYGQSLFEQCEQTYQSQSKQFLEQYHIVYLQPSGPLKHKGITVLNTHNNHLVTGWIMNDGQKVLFTPSPVVLITDRWCLTNTGDVYRLGELTSRQVVQQAISG